MKFDLKLEDMNKTEGIFKTQYGEHDDTKYEYTFKSGHELHIYQLFGNHPWIYTFYTPGHTDAGERGGWDTPQKALDDVRRLFEENSIRTNLIKGFVF